ncbi:MAG: phosphatase PAP2 family protein [Phycisphaerae bacterium]|nr:phosphatase PAP2 family protein [Phycisphaerae bacterium]
MDIQPTTKPSAGDRPAYRFYDPQLLPGSTAATGWRRSMWIAAWSVVAIVFVFALIFDVKLMLWPYSMLPKGPRGLLDDLVVGFRNFGQAFLMIVACLIIYKLDARRWTIIPAILLAQLIGIASYNGVKLVIVRNRPLMALGNAENALRRLPVSSVPAEASATSPHAAMVEHMTQGQGPSAADSNDSVDSMRKVWRSINPTDLPHIVPHVRSWRGLAFFSNQEGSSQSFPSGHSGAAFALAGVLAWFYPPLALLWWALAVGCSASRYVDAVHWVSDCIAGACIGYMAAQLALRPHWWQAMAQAITAWTARLWTKLQRGRSTT